MLKDRNYFGFVWHSFWLSLTVAFAEKNTVMPALILLAGGSQKDVGILTAIMIGIPFFTQLLFASILTNKRYKKPYLILGILIRVFAFFGTWASIAFFAEIQTSSLIYLIFIWMFLFSISGAFAGLSYNDIIGKSFDGGIRKKLYVAKQFTGSLGVLVSALFVKKILSGYTFPENYQIGFFLAGIILFLASIGFMIIKEKPAETGRESVTFTGIIKNLPSALKNDPALKYFIIITNLIGFTIILIPFYVGYAKSIFELTKESIGNFLLIEIIGMVASNYIWNKYLKNHSLKGMLKITVIIFAFTPVVTIILALSGSLTFFVFVFLIIGAALSAQKITLSAVIIEISNDQNRVLYSGIYGTFNFTLALLPIIIGYLIEHVGYFGIFASFSLITLSALFFMKKLVCPADIKSPSINTNFEV